MILRYVKEHCQWQTFSDNKYGKLSLSTEASKAAMRDLGKCHPFSLFYYLHTNSHSVRKVQSLQVFGTDAVFLTRLSSLERHYAGKINKKKSLITYYERWSKLFNSVACTNFICLVAKIVFIKRVQIKLLLLLLLLVVSSSSSSWSSCCFCCCWQWWDSEVAYRWLARG